MHAETQGHDLGVHLHAMQARVAGTERRAGPARVPEVQKPVLGSAAATGEERGEATVTKAGIEERAREVLRDHGMLDMAVDPIGLAHGLEVKVFNAKFGDETVHGLLAKREGRATIYVNTDDSPVRKRFTIAHELGHLILHLIEREGQIIDNADNFRTTFDPDAAWNDARRREWEANVFASELLMNGDLVHRKWREIRDAEGMARWFQVSRQAMDLRLDGLRISTE
ncbi:MAG: ImmA/IrrE family metallo-endopeptidase [Candidatus Binatia bacterium]